MREVEGGWGAMGRERGREGGEEGKEGHGSTYKRDSHCPNSM